jgi:hypothetical protein
MIVEKVYRVFDSLFLNRKDAEALLVGWEHKETIDVRYAILEHTEEAFVDGENLGIPATEAMLFRSKEDALKELRENL